MNLLSDYGYNKKEIEARVLLCWHTLFEGKKSERIYFEVGDDMGYITDTGNNDVRTEGMSYGMMMAVQMNKKDVFDRIWKWTRTYMYLDEGDNKGFFCWSNQLDGKKNSEGPAPDGEEYFAMALFFASHRWGNGKGIFNYEKEARAILHAALHGKAQMWNKENHLIRFVCNCPFSDPSYHLPHFYDLFAMWADPQDSDFWSTAAGASRAYLVTACNKKTGLAPEYAENSGTPLPLKMHGSFFSDSYRVAANIGLNAMWFGDVPDLAGIASNIITFFDGKKVEDFMDYKIDGTPLRKKARHPIGLCATIAEAALALERSKEPITAKQQAATKRAVKRFWETPLRTGKRRYYDNCLYFFAMLALSGNYNVY